MLRRSKVEAVVEHGVSQIVHHEETKPVLWTSESIMVAPEVQMCRSASSDGGVLGDDGDSNAAEI